MGPSGPNSPPSLLPPSVRPVRKEREQPQNFQREFLVLIPVPVLVVNPSDR